MLNIHNLSVSFDTPDGTIQAVKDVSLTMHPGEYLGIVGESGSGKTQAVLAILGLLAKNGRSTGIAEFAGENLLSATNERLNAIRGNRIAMIFQDPMTALNPYLTVADQMIEVLQRHMGYRHTYSKKISIDMLEQLGLNDASRRIDNYPHEFSGGMRQRIMIATALLCEPDLLIADEPTTALDTTTQAMIVDLIKSICKKRNMSLLLITHNLSLVASMCDRVSVMYAGRIIEIADCETIFSDAHHPYTRGLLHSIPRLDSDFSTVGALDGQPPSLINPPNSCAFMPRCNFALSVCQSDMPTLKYVAPASNLTWLSRCHRNADYR